ncbi:MAG: dynamin family protein [Trichodesmium sp. MAG_R03]|nr:dynamin family protein [Trichodesmium sp. MAG_R03]
MLLEDLISEIIRKRKTTANIPKKSVDYFKCLELKISKLKDLQESILKLPTTTSMGVQQFYQINFQIILNRIVQERQVWETLRQRLNRDTINIGVVGLARQGKSTFLQNVAGLTNEQDQEIIPSSDRLPCTTVQSNIYHHEGDTYAKVYFHSESSFIEQIITPYYRELGFKNIPKNLNQFANLPFPSKPINHHHSAKAEAIYEHLRMDYYVHINKYSSLLQSEKRFIRVQKSEIRKYVSQSYDAKSNPQFFNHLAVEKVEIFCTFPEVGVKKIALVDMPGLGDTRLGDTERMIKALAEDIDFILLIRRPGKKGTGDFLRREDVNLYDVASQALKDKLPLKEWVFMLLNQDGENEQLSLDFNNTMASKGIHVKQCLKANCKNSKAANQVMEKVLHYLIKNMQNLDKQYMSAALKDLSNFQTWIEEKLQEIRQAIAGYADIDTEYVQLRELFLAELYESIEGFRKKLREELSEPNKNFKEQVDQAINRCKKPENIPNFKDIKTLAKRKGIDRAYFLAIQQMRPSILQHFHTIEDGLKDYHNQTKSDLADIFIDLGIGSLVNAENADFWEAFAELLAQKNNLPNLARGFKFIASFEVMYKGFMQSYVWQKISEVISPDPVQPINTPENIDNILTNLQQRHQIAIEVCQKTLNQLGISVNRTRVSMVEEFADHITRAKGVELEWEILLSKNRSQIWSQFQELETQQELQKKWFDLVDEALFCNKEL